MAPSDRFPRLVECATRVFIAQGYRRTQMDDVAREMGVAKGTLYLYVESKEALFDVAVRNADREVRIPSRLPVPTPRHGATVAWLREAMADVSLLGDVRRIVGKRRSSAAADLESILRRTYRGLAAHRTGIKLADRCAADYPGLAELWFGGGREGFLDLLSRFLQSRGRLGTIRRFPDTAVAARTILETLVFWAVHRHWDPSPQKVDEDTAEETVIHFVSAALLPEGGVR